MSDLRQMQGVGVNVAMQQGAEAYLCSELVHQCKKPLGIESPPSRA